MLVSDLMCSIRHLFCRFVVKGDEEEEEEKFYSTERKLFKVPRQIEREVKKFVLKFLKILR